jgi:DNA primase large subunit
MVCKPTHTSIQPNEDFDLYLKDGDEEAANRTYDESEILGPVNGDLYPPCIVNVISKLKATGYLTHDERLHLTAYFRQSGWHREDVFKLFEQSNDWKDRVTRYHVKYAFDNKAKCYGCKKAIKLKFCVKKNQRECPFYPSINRTAFGTTNGVNGNGELQSEGKILAS